MSVRVRAVLCLAVLALTAGACGGKDITGIEELPPPADNETTVSVRIVIPQGVGVSPDSLRLVAGVHATGSTGSGISANILAEAAQLLAAVAPNGDPVLLAITLGDQTSSADLSLQSTAEALVFLTPGLVSSSRDTAAAIMSAIRASARLPELMRLLLARLADNPPGALVADDPALAAATRRVAEDAANTMGQQGASTVVASIFEPEGPTDLSGVRITSTSGGVTVENRYRRFLSAIVSYSTDGIAYQTSTADNGSPILPRHVVGVSSLLTGNPTTAVLMRSGPPYARLKVFGAGFGAANDAFADPDAAYALYPVVGHVIFNWAVPLFQVVTGIRGLQSLEIWAGESSVGSRWISATLECVSLDAARAALFNRNILSLARPTLLCAFTELLRNADIGAALAASTGASFAVDILTSAVLPLRIVLLAKNALELTHAVQDVARSNVAERFYFVDPTARPPAWDDGFESYQASSWPELWLSDGNATETAENHIDPTAFASGSRSLRLYGLVSGCWASNAYRALAVTPPFTVEVAVRNGNEPLSGCHPFRASLMLRQCCSWVNPARELALFKPDGVLQTGAGTVLAAYDPMRWYNLRIRYEQTSSSLVRLSYWLDGRYLLSETLPVQSAESSLEHLEVSVQEGSAWFDNVRVIK